MSEDNFGHVLSVEFTEMSFNDAAQLDKTCAVALCGHTVAVYQNANDYTQYMAHPAAKTPVGVCNFVRQEVTCASCLLLLFAEGY